MTSSADHIQALEQAIAAGNIAAMAQIIEQAHEEWDAFSDSDKKDFSKLEAAFISIVTLKTGATA